MLRDERGYSITWWAGFVAFLLLPMLWLGVGVGRYAIAAAEVQEAADLAALAASRDVLVGLFENEGYLAFADYVPYRRAETYANLNTDYLDAEGIHVRVTYVYADWLEHTVTVRCAADVSELFPEVFPPIVVERTGIAKVRMRVWLPEGGLSP
jgi:hypothetical protein